MGHSRLSTAVLAIITCLLWSSAFAGIKIGLQYSPPLQFAGIRFFISGLLVLPLAYRLNPDYFGQAASNWKFILLFAFLQTFLQYILLYTGITLIPGAVTAMLIGSQPLFIAVVAHFFMPGDRITWRKAAVVMVGITGVVLVSLGKDPASRTGRVALTGILLMVGVNIISGINNVIIAREKRRIPPLVISSASMLIGGLGLFLFSIPVEGIHLGPKPAAYWLSLGWLSMLSAVAISIWLTLLKRPGIVVSDLNLWKFLIPLSGALLSWWLVPGEQPEVISIAGMSIIALSLVFLNLINRKKLPL